MANSDKPFTIDDLRIASELMRPMKPILNCSTLVTSQEMMLKLEQHSKTTERWGDALIEPIVNTAMRLITYYMSPIIPVRAHNPKANGGKVSYHKRIQKKWDKRWGFMKNPLNDQILLINNDAWDNAFNAAIMGDIKLEPVKSNAVKWITGGW